MHLPMQHVHSREFLTEIKYQFKISSISLDLAHLSFRVLMCESLHVRTFKCMLLRDIQYNLEMTFGKLLIIPLNLYKPYIEELVSKFTHIKMSFNGCFSVKSV